MELIGARRLDFSVEQTFRLRELLLFVGRRSLKDGCTQVREQDIWIEVFGRAQAYDTALDNIVRTNVSDLRKRIEAYFDSEGLQETVIMEIPRGSYVPIFRYRPVEPPRALEAREAAVAPASEPPAVLGEARLESARRMSTHPGWMAAIVVICLLAACCVALWL